ncbi:hypothetical protein BKA64DRAFT_680154 [Cadophora sp. MPI-SDFR-AT-0126]|nr:hypothetical protein BKA64DRAFT_680154 [Leotiomycetes sp. MPI-SDFR-AT-0126]
MTVQTRSSPQLKLHVTPPSSFTTHPLTPPPTDEKSPTVLRIIRDIRRRKAEVGAGAGIGKTKLPAPVPWTAYSLDAEAYTELLRRFECDENLAAFVDHELRFDYFPSTRRLILRMPTAVHEYFIHFVVQEIRTQLGAFTGSSGAFAKDVKFGGSTRISFDDSEYGCHDPDGQFKHENAQYPGVVIEVSYSQKKRDLPHLADEYILGSDANIQCVIGLDIEYGGKGKAKMATWSVWEPVVEEGDNGRKELVAKQTVHNTVFRTPTGTPPSPSNQTLEIPLRAFAPSSCYSTDPPQGSIIIPAAKLYTFLANAEKTGLMLVEKKGLVVPAKMKTWGAKRRREITPEEELLARDEKRFKTEEDSLVEKEEADDASWGKGSAASDVS